MLYLNKLKSAKTKNKTVEFSLIPKDLAWNDFKQGKGQIIYNFLKNKSGLKSGMGFEKLAASVDRENINDEVVLNLKGTQVKGLYQLIWHDNSSSLVSYYIFYFNENKQICYDSLYERRLIPSTIPNNFTDVPVALPYKKNNIEYLIFSGNGSSIIVGNAGYSTLENVPSMKSCVNHYGKFFAITNSTQPKLVYSSNVDVESWTDSQVKNLDFNDERGELQKLVSFNDYIYIFRSFGITQLSVYSSSGEFSISHMYRAGAYINPNTVVEYGDKIYFVEDGKLREFNGNSVKDIDVKSYSLMKGQNNLHLFGACHNGKYFLACRCDFGDDETIGCESYSGGYTNNALISYDLENGDEEIMRGVDINELMNYVTPFKSKLLASFRNQHIDKIGQLTNDGKLFGTSLKGKFETTSTDFGSKDSVKILTKITYKFKGTATCLIVSDRASKTFTLKGNGNAKTKRLSMTGKEFKFVLYGEGSDIMLNDFVATAKVRDEN